MLNRIYIYYPKNIEEIIARNEHRIIIEHGSFIKKWRNLKVLGNWALNGIENLRWLLKKMGARLISNI